MRRTATLGLALAGLAAGLVSAVPAANATSSAAAAPAAPPAAPPKLTWKKCATVNYRTLQCASLRVPLDYAKPDGRQITLALSRVPGTAKKKQGPLLVNPGGPGGSGLTLAGFVAMALPKKTAARYDVVGFDPRGVGDSEPAIDCRPGHFDPVRPDSVPQGGGERKANLKRAEQFAKGCTAKYGASLLKRINTRNTVRDMDRIREALGVRQINYLGYSYGTYLGTVYADLFPTRVRRLVLDSVVDPSGVWYEDNIAQDYAFEDNHQAFLAWVAKYDADYHLGTTAAAVEKKWYAMRKALRAKPANKLVGPAELEDTFLTGGYYNGYWPLLAEGFEAYVNEGDADALQELYANFGANEDTNGYSVYTAVQCRDAKWPAWRQWDRDTVRVHEKAPFLAWNNTWYNAPCMYWPAAPQQPTALAGDDIPPALLIQSTGDAATPYAGALKVHRLLKGSRLVVEDGGRNHGVSLSGNACLDKRLAAYLDTGALPAQRPGPDATCGALPEPDPDPIETEGGEDAVGGPAASKPTTLRAPASAPAQAPAPAQNGAALHRMIGRM